MERRGFIKSVAIMLGTAITAPFLLTKSTNKTDLPLDFSKFDVYYDFTKPEYGIYNHKGEIIGWKDISGNGRDAHTPIAIGKSEVNVKRFAISNRCENLVEYL